MKNKNIVYVILSATLLSLSGCTENFLHVDPMGTDLESTYYKDADEAFNGLVAAYDPLGYLQNYVSKVTILSSGSDDHYAGAGGPQDMIRLQAISNYNLLEPALGPQDALWKRNFMGITRANILLEKLPDVPMDENVKRRYVAEAKFLRAYYYFDVVRLFKNVPLFRTSISTTEMFDVTQVAPADVYTSIEQDLNESFADLPEQITDIANDGGRATQGAAKALLGKVLLQQEKFLEAAAVFEEVNGTPGATNRYGYRLLDNYADLFVISNKFNSESIFEICHTHTSGTGWGNQTTTEGNTVATTFGPRQYERLTPDAPDFVSGWSCVVITPNLFEFIKDDPRYDVTVANMRQLKEDGKVNYTPGYMDTGYFLAKFMTREGDIPTGQSGEPSLNIARNMYEMRLADLYLLEAEALIRGNGDLTRAALLLNAVRNRVGLGAVAATFQNVKNERRLELVGEGHRWFDLVRWGDAAAALGSRGFVAGKHEILPIPLLELENTSLEQNREWGGTR